MRPRILLDIDGVVANTIEAALAVARRDLDVAHGVIHDDIHTWAIEESIGLNEAQKEQFYASWRAPGFVASMKPYAGALVFVEQLKSIGDVVPVTASFPRSGNWILEREAWITEHLRIPASEIVHTHAKHLVAGDIIIEDKPSNIQRWSEHWPYGCGILIARMYNRNSKVGVRVDSYYNAIERIKAYLGGIHLTRTVRGSAFRPDQPWRPV